MAFNPDGFGYLYTQPPSGGSGGSSKRTRRDFAIDVLRGLGMPVTNQNLLAMVAWMSAENTKARFNPFATTQGWPGATKFNSVGVRNYASWADGVAATIKTMRLGYYTRIRAALKQGNAGYAVIQAIAESPWGTGKLVYSTWRGVSANATKFFNTLVGTQASGAGVGGPPGGGGGGSTAGFAAQLRNAGIPNFIDVDGYIDQALALGLTGEEAFAYVYSQVLRSPEFRTAFPGIFRPDGTMRMSPAQWLEQAGAYRAMGARFGVSLSREHIGHWVSLEVGADEARERFNAIQTVKTNPNIRRFLKLYSGTDSLKEAVQFVLRKAPKQVYDTFEAAQLSAVATDLGLKTSKGRALGIARRTEGVLTKEEIEARYKRLADQLRVADVELAAVGLTQRQLEIIEFGGPRRAALASRAERMLRQREADIQTPQGQQAIRIERGRPVLASGPPIEPGL